MTLNINDIKPFKGKISCNLWENSNINLPMSLFYSIEIPLQPFNSGQDYVYQPTETSIMIEWIVFEDLVNGQQEANWKKLVGRQFDLSYQNENAEGSIYLGSEHCLLNSQITFLSLSGNTFEVEFKMAIDFNIETSNLDSDGLVKFKTQLEFEGLRICHTQLPTYQKAENKLELLGNFIDLNVYQKELTKFDDNDFDCLMLRAL